MNEIFLQEEAKKQTEHLRAIRNWVAAIGIVLVVIPIAAGIIYLIIMGLMF